MISNTRERRRLVFFVACVEGVGDRSWSWKFRSTSSRIEITTFCII
jgi:hypothetical protein